jgi:flagellar motor protein MotB
MVKRTLLLATMLFLSVTMGCTYCQRFAAGGAVVGGAIGGVWASETMGALNVAEGIGVGAAAGGLAGALVGDILDYNKLKRTEAERDAYKEENDKLKAQLAACQQELANANRKIAELQAELDKLRDQLAHAIQPVLEINLAADLIFRPGSATLNAAGRAKLDDAAQKIMANYRDKFVMIEGHTDAQPIKHSHWKSNWELGAARSLTVLHYLTDKGVDPALLSGATFSKYQPLADNDTKEGRAQNRRAVIVIYSNWPHAKANAK